MTRRAGVAPTGGVWQGFVSAWQHRELILRLASRDLIVGFRGSALGLLWLMVLPLGTLVIFTLSVTSLRGIAPAAGQHPLGFTLFIFCGLIFFQMFADLMIRAPNVLAENVAFIKKVIFPVEIVAWVALARSLAAATVSLVLLLALTVAVQGVPPATMLLVPLVVVSFCLMLLGLIWVIAIVGVFLRDIAYLFASLMPAFMFLTPVFYPVSGFAEIVRPVAYVNPLTIYIESTRTLLIDGTVPYAGLLAGLVLALIVFLLGNAFFRANRYRIVDAL